MMATKRARHRRPNVSRRLRGASVTLLCTAFCSTVLCSTQRANAAEEEAAPVELSTEGTATATNDDESAQAIEDYLRAENEYELEAESPKAESSAEPDSLPSETPRLENVELPTADSSGVSGQAISLPKGEGSIQGMEESFSAQLSTGIATFNVPIALPQGRGNAQPSLGLSYSSAGGHGVSGVGWSIGVPFIARQTDKGIPGYDDQEAFHHEQDRFVFNGGQELVPICVVAEDLGCQGALSEVPDSEVDGALISEEMPPWSAGWQYFRPRVEGSFLRFFWSPDHETWRVQDKSGVTMELGVPAEGSDRNALETNPADDGQIYRWHLSRQFDIYGGLDAPLNSVVYRYEQRDGMTYLSDIFYTPPTADPSTPDLDAYAHHARLVYEARPDATQSYRSGWLIEQTQRLVRVDVTSKPFGTSTGSRELVRRYHFGYDATFHASLLTSVQVEGRCEDTSVQGEPQAHATESGGVLGATACPRLPPMRFDYSHVQGMLADGSATAPALAGYEAFDERTIELSESPGHSLDETQTSLMDVNSDGLPDVIVTAAGLFDGDHGVFFNSTSGSFGTWLEDRVLVSGESSAGTIKLSNLNVAPLDADGDGIVDLVHMPRVKDYSIYSLTRQSGAWTWLGRPIETSDGLNPTIDLGNDAAHIRVLDVNFDGLVDVVRTTGTQLQTFLALGRYPDGDARFGQGTRTGIETSTLLNEPIRKCLPWSGTALSFDDRDTQLADMNGDGITDIVRLRRGDVHYWPGRGNGYWGTGDPLGCEPDTFENDTEIAMADSPYYSDIQGTSMRMEDVNGDGLTDLVQVRYDEVDVYLNVDGAGWTDRHILQNTTESPSFANTVRLTDINGSGTPDILWGNSGRYKYVDITGGIQPHLLVKVENGLGKTTELEYVSSASEMLAAAAAGNAWSKTAPTVTQVVKRVTEKDNVTIAGRPPASYVTEYSYRDPVYEGRQREFRGFAYAEVKQIGDSNSPTSLSASHFLLGECEDETDDGEDDCSLPNRWRDNPKEALKGLPYLTETFDENGGYLSTTHNQYTLRRLYQGLDGREVRYAFQSGTRTFLYDNAPFTPADATGTGTECSTGDGCAVTVSLELEPPEWEGAAPDLELVSSAAASKHHLVLPRSTTGSEVMRSETTVDFFGNQLQSIARGREGVDEVITQTSIPARPGGDPTGWLWRTVESFVTGSLHTERRNVQRITYDENGDPRVTRSVLAGTLPLDRAVNAPGSDPVASVDGDVTVSATQYDDFGNPLFTRGANLRCATVAYDPEYAYLPITETIFTRGCEPEAVSYEHALATTASYDRGLGIITTATNVQGQETRIEYDGFGRMVRMFAPDPDVTGAVPENTPPSLEIEYFLPPAFGPFHSYIHTKAQDGATNQSTQYLESWAIIDGFGRTITTLAEDEEVQIESDMGSEMAQRWIVGALQEWDQKSAVRKKYLEFYTTGDPREFDFGAVPPTYYGRQRYDAFGRQLQTFDLDGTVTLQSRYHALSSDAFDAADLGPSPHAGTPLSTAKDGHGRTLQVVERFKEGATLVERITETAYLPTGEPEVIARRNGTTSDVVSRWFAYDTMGRMVLNVEPNTSKDYALAAKDNPAAWGDIEAWRYRYNDAGDLVGMSDARGCGVNFFHDGAGRLLGEDYFGCEVHHAQHSPPSIVPVAGDTGEEIDLPFTTEDKLPPDDGTGSGFEVLYTYDEFIEPEGNTDDYDVDCTPATGPPEFRQGRLVRVQDLASQNYTLYDGRGRVRCVATRVATPYDVNAGTAVPEFASRYTPRWYGMRYAYDAADRIVEETTGVRTDALLADNDESKVSTVYSTRGVVDRVFSSYNLDASGPNLISQINRTADNLVTLVRYGDLAETATTYTYDDRRRAHTVLTSRSAPGGNWPAEPSGDGTYQMVLQDEQFFYDAVNNPIEIRDNRIPEEWPAGAKPVSKKIQYDDLYRASRIDYQYTAGDDAWVSPHDADLDTVGDARRAKPSPHVQFAKRILWQTYAYDWLGNNAVTEDDASGFYDRSLGDIDNGTANDGPYQLRGAALDEMDPSNSLTAAYDASGNLESMFVRRNGGLGCVGGASCSQSFLYRWDELGRLVHAKRWDGASQNLDFNAGGFDADLKYVYGTGDERVIKTATQEAEGDDPQAHTLYIYPSLELRRAAYGGEEYTRDGTTEVGYLFANGVRLARLVNRPNQSDPPPDTGGDLRVFFELGDHLGSTSAALDKATGELVERATYQAYGARESDYRPGRWGEFREDYGFTGKEEDVEVGLVYFGKRFYAPSLQRWVSADPLEVHDASTPDANVYAYVSGQPLQNVDPIGLEPIASAADEEGNPAVIHDSGVMESVSPEVVNAGVASAERSESEPAQSEPDTSSCVGANGTSRTCGAGANVLGFGEGVDPEAAMAGAERVLRSAEEALAAAEAHLQALEDAVSLIPCCSDFKQARERAGGDLREKQQNYNIAKRDYDQTSRAYRNANTRGHQADWEHRGSGGRIKTRGTEQSGSKVKPGRRLSFDEQLKVHTETKILDKLKGTTKPGDIITIRGTKAPCNPGNRGCVAAMQKFATENNVSIRYTAGGKTWTFPQ
jgi:RHS repeat-associated protein